MADRHTPSRPAPRLAPSKGSLAWFAEKSSAERWAETLDQALAESSAAEAASRINRGPDAAGTAQDNFEMAQDLCFPIQHAILRQQATGLRDVVIMAAIAADLSSAFPATLKASDHGGLEGDARSVSIGLDAIVAFVLGTMPPGAASLLPQAAHSAVLRACARHAARFPQVTADDTLQDVTSAMFSAADGEVA